MKRVRRFYVNGDDSEKIRITLEYNKKADWNSRKIEDEFENIADEIFSILQKHWHTFAIKVLK